MEQATYLSGLMIVEAKLNIDGTRVRVADFCDACDLVAKLGQNPRYAAFSGRFWPKPALDAPGQRADITSVRWQ
jgi:hypothetical protein